MPHDVFISYASQDKSVADVICDALESSHIRCWIAPRDVMPGTEWAETIVDALDTSQVIVLVLSSNSNNSPQVIREIGRAVSKGITIIPLQIEDISISKDMAFYLSSSNRLDARTIPLGNHLKRLNDLVQQILAPESVLHKDIERAEVPQAVEPEKTSKGYVFISYVRNDRDFVEKLRGILKSRRYAYWDYVVGDRDYHGKLYRELEERIDNAAAFMTIISDQWRESDWIASEFIYARESQKPIFVIQAKRLKKPLPMILNLQTRIDMSADFEKGTRVLIEELEKKGL